MTDMEEVLCFPASPSPFFLHLPDLIDRWLKLWATVSLCVYGIGTPSLFLCVLVHYRKAFKVDQVLRKTGLGYTRASNPHFVMRRRQV